MALFNQRAAIGKLEQAEADGESFWTGDLEHAVRVKLVHTFHDFVEAGQWEDDPRAFAHRLVCRDEGVFDLAGQRYPVSDFDEATMSAPTPVVLSMIESFQRSITHSLLSYRKEIGPGRVDAYRSRINSIFARHRVSFELIGDEVVSFESREMHVSVTKPALLLLAEKEGWQEVEKSYQNALAEIADSKPADAITDAATALQTALVLCGAEGNALGPLAKSAKTKGLLAAHDPTFMDGLEKLIHWVSADRSEKGEAHKIGSNEVADAWFSIHIVGALILRLASGERGQS